MKANRRVIFILAAASASGALAQDGNVFYQASETGMNVHRAGHKGGAPFLPGHRSALFQRQLPTK